MWKCYITLKLQIIPAVSLNCTRSPPLPLPSASCRVRWRSGWCFPHFKRRLWMFDELMVLADGFVWAGCQHISQTQAPARTLANTCSPNCFGLIRRGLLLHHKSPEGILLPVPPYPCTATFPSLILEMRPRCGWRDSPWAKQGEPIFDNKGTHKEAMKSRWSVG